MIQIGRPSPGMLKYSAAGTNVVCDGNSLTIGAFASGPSAYYPAQMAALPPISGQFSVTNLGVSGQTTRMMNGLDTGSAGDVDSAYATGKRNILFPWEGTNSVDVAGRSGAEWAQDMEDYVQARLTAHSGWLIVLVTSLPFIRNTDTQSVTNAKNAAIDAGNAILRARCRAMGAVGLVDLRVPGSPFALPDYTLASFNAATVSSLWATGEDSGTHIHLSDAGYAWVAAQCAAALRRVRIR